MDIKPERRPQNAPLGTASHHFLLSAMNVTQHRGYLALLLVICAYLMANCSPDALDYVKSSFDKRFAKTFRVSFFEYCV